MPFEGLSAKSIVEVDNGRILLFPIIKGFLRDSYLLETMDCNDIGNGLITRGPSMIK